MGTVFYLTLRQLSGRWRIVIMSVLATLPVLLTMLLLGADNAPSVQEFDQMILGTMLAGSITPLVVLAIAAAAFGNEVEDRTLANLTLAPIPRWQVALPKLFATIAIAAPFIAISAALTSSFAFLADWQATIAVTVSSIVGVALYAAVFVWLGLVSTQAIGVGLLYIVVWEGFFSGFVAGVRLLSIRHYAIAIMHGLDARRFAGYDHPSLPIALGLSALVFTAFAWLSIRRLRQMDVP